MSARGATALALALASLAVACGGDEPREAVVAIAPPSESTAHEREIASLRLELEHSAARELDLRRELDRVKAERVEREREWLAYTRSIAELGELAKLAEVHFQPAVDPAAAPADPLAPAAAPTETVDAHASKARDARDLEIARTLRALFLADQVGGLDVLECGHLADGAIGPVVLRTLDDRGVPLGAICAERMKLEASLSARTLTLVLEDGYERRGAERVPFEVPLDAPQPAPAASEPPAGRHGERRIVLAYIDPQPWVDALPELFRDVDRRPLPDDGRWDRIGVVVALNRLLRIDAAAGMWRLVALGGIEGDVLREVQLDGLDREGKLEKKLFADRLTIEEQKSGGVVLLLEDGAQLRGDVKTPFLDGRFRIFLPRADVAEWRTAGIPGIAPTPQAQRDTPREPGARAPDPRQPR